MDRRAWSMILALAAIWGASYMFIKFGLRDLSPALVAWVRVALGAAVLLALAAHAGVLRGFRSRVGTITLIAAIQVAGPFLLIALGEEEISSGLAGILIAAAPLFTALLAVWVDHEERSQGMRLGGVLLGLVGVAVLLGVDLSGSGAALLGGLAVVLAALGYAIGGFLVKHRFAGAPPTGLAAWVMVASTLLLLPAGGLTLPSEVPGIGPLVAVAALGVLGTGVAFALFYDLIGRVGPAKSFIVTYLAPGFAVAYGALFLDEVITVATIVGLVLIVGGSWLAAEGRLPGRRGPIPQPSDGFGSPLAAQRSSSGAGR
jgi:drug/metabolite transporter (DMT)-like permease